MRVLSTIDPAWKISDPSGFEVQTLSFLRHFAEALEGKGGEFSRYFLKTRWSHQGYLGDLEDALSDAEFIFHSESLMRSSEDLYLAGRAQDIIRDRWSRAHDYKTRNKLGMARGLRRFGFSVPFSRTIGDYLKEDDRTKPVIIKPRIGANGRNVYYVPWQGLVEIIFRDEKSPLKLGEKDFLVQDFVDPGTFPNHYRVLVAGGQVLGCVLSARDDAPFQSLLHKGEGKGDYDRIAAIGEENVTSNAYKGAIQIPVSHPVVYNDLVGYEDFAVRVLDLHGLDGSGGMPAGLEEFSLRTAKKLEKSGFRYIGLDISRDVNTRELYVYDWNSAPAFKILKTLFIGRNATNEDSRKYAAETIVDALMAA